MESVLNKFEKMNIDKCYFRKFNLSHKQKKAKNKYKLKKDVNHLKSRIKKLELTLLFLRENCLSNTNKYNEIKKYKEY